MNYATKIKTAIASALCVMVGMAFAITETSDVQIYGATFESTANRPINDYAYTNGTAITDITYRTVAPEGEDPAVYGWFAGSEEDGSHVTNDEVSVSQVLSLNTDAMILTNVLSQTVADQVNDAISGESDGALGTYECAVFESDVKFVASDTLDPGIIGGSDATKFAIYAYCDDSGDNPTNLVVYHAYDDGGIILYTNYVFSSVLIDTTAYTHLRVEMKQVTRSRKTYNLFSVAVNGVTVTNDLASEVFWDGDEYGQWFFTTEQNIAGNHNIASLNFKGTGEIDNIKVSKRVTETYEAIYDGVKYALLGTAATAAIADSSKLMVAYAAGTIDLANENDAILLDTNGYAVAVTTSAAGCMVTETPQADGILYESKLAAATILFISADGTYTNSLTVSIGATPVYGGDAQYTNNYADATGIYTFEGWTPPLAPAAGYTEYRATFSSVASVASMNGTYYASLQAALDAIAAENLYDAVITLNSDAEITISKNGNLLGGSNTTNITINGNAKTLNVIRNGTWAQFNTENSAAKLVLNNVNLTSEFTGTMTEWTSQPLQNPNHNIAFNCDVELNNVNSDTALSFWKDAALDTVTIEETVDVYSIWIHTTAGNVSIKDLVVNTSTGRGIKVDDSYVRAAHGRTPSATTISIDGAAFTTTVSPKAAVLVRSAYPVAITADNYNISAVTADTEHLVWVDEAISTNFGIVTLNGGQAGIAAEPYKKDGVLVGYAASFSTNGTWISGYYKTLAEVVAVAHADDTVTLQKNVTETLSVAKPMTITRNGFTADNVTPGEGYDLTTTTESYVFTALVPKATVITITDAGATTNVIDNYASFAAALDAAPAGSTILLLADDDVSFSMSNLEISIGKAITIDGCGHTIYGVNDYNYYDSTTGGADHDIFITRNAGNVTIKNLHLTEFGGAAYVSQNISPLYVSGAYAGTLTLDNVTIDKFNRHALFIGGGTAVVTNCTLTGDAPTPRNAYGAYFQEGIEVYYADVTVADTTITGMGAYDPDWEDSNAAAAIQLTSSGSITVDGGTYSGQYAVMLYEDATGSVTLEDGDFTGELDDGGAAGSLTVNGGTFDRVVPAEYAGAGLAPTTITEGGKYTVKTARTVSFVVSGSSYTNIVVADSEPVSEPADPEPAIGVEFDYWYLGTNDSVEYNFATLVTSNITLTAKFSAIAPAGYAADDVVAGVTLTTEQASWLNTLRGETSTADYTASIVTAGTDLEQCYLLNVNPAVAGNGGSITVTAITVGGDVTVTVRLTRTGEISQAIKGKLKLYGTASLGTVFDELDNTTITDDDFSEGNTATATFSGSGAKFFKAVIE